MSEIINKIQSRRHRMKSESLKKVCCDCIVHMIGDDIDCKHCGVNMLLSLMIINYEPKIVKRIKG